MSLSVLIVDDEQPAREVIKHYLSDYPELTVVAECDNGFDALKQIQALAPDIVFLDIQMPKLTGFEMLELLDDPPVIIFSTAYDHFALQAFEVSAADYLLKPYSRERFAEAVQRARALLANKTAQRNVISRLVAESEKREAHLERVVVKEGAQIHLIPVDKIYWLEAQDDYVMLHTRDGRYLKGKTLKYFEQHLDPAVFVRIHRSHIVRIASIKQLDVVGKDAYRAMLDTGKTLPVSRSGHARLKTLLET